MKVLVTGSKGQLGQELNYLSKKTGNLDFVFTDVAELDITNYHETQQLFKKHQFQVCINCAAYTAVDRAETERELCDKINVTGAENLAKCCSEFSALLIHISTDFVFDGNANTPIDEKEKTNPVNYYGKSKLDGEQVIKEQLKEYLILRTSWLYSTFGSNFVKTMIKLSKDRDEINIIADQAGTPTYARDLAKSIISMIQSENHVYGTFHFSNEGMASWYDFTKAIFEYKKIKTRVNPIPTEKYPTPAKRPKYSVLDKSKIRDAYQLNIPYWRDSLKECIREL